MIADPTTVANLRADWEGVVRMRERMRRLVCSSLAGGAFTAPALSKVVYNLPLLLAFDVLRQVLVAARNEGLFACPNDRLGNLMESAQGALSWIDWDELRAGVRRRNEVAHEGKLFEGSLCLLDIARIEAQLMAWAVIAAP